MTPDFINGMFEFVGAAICMSNVRRIRRDRTVKGFDPMTTVFFTGWGVWNIYFYSHLEQWISWLGGIALALVNLVWLIHVFYYWIQDRRIDRKREQYRNKVLSSGGKVTKDGIEIMEVKDVSFFVDKDGKWKR